MKPAGETSPTEFKKFWRLLPCEAQEDAWLIPLTRRDKRPDVSKGESWQDEKYRLTPGTAKKRLESGGNVGITFRGKAGVADIDHVDRAKAYFGAELVETLIVRTRDRKLHLYYLNDGSIQNHDYNEDGVHVLEFRTSWRYVVAPGSYVPPTPGSGGDGLYRVVNTLPPKLITAKDFPWLNKINDHTKFETKPIKFDGKYLGLPCTRIFFETPLQDGRATRASKLVAIACVMDGIVGPELRDIDRRFVEFQNQHNPKRLPFGGIVRWVANIQKTGKTWNCGEVVNYFRGLGIYPPCGSCPVKVEVRRQ